MLLLEVLYRRDLALKKLQFLKSLYSDVSACSANRQGELYSTLFDQESKTTEFINNCNVIIRSAEASVEVEVNAHKMRLGDLREWIDSVEGNIEAIDRVILAGVKVIDINSMLSKREQYLNTLIKYRVLYNEAIAKLDTDSLGKPMEE